MSNTERKPFSLIDFVPSWPSSVMGTGIIPVALLLGQSSVPFFRPLAMAIFALSLLLFLLILTLWILRCIRHPVQLRQELHHPVAGSFLPTMPISFMIIAIDILLIGPGIIGNTAALIVAFIAFIIGTAGIYLFSWLIMPALFRNTQVSEQHGTFGWFIPPVSHLIIPVAGLELVHRSSGILPGNLLLFVSLASLGIGLLLFILIGPNVFFRYIYRSSPVGKMAPTLLIALAPTSILIIIFVKIHVILGHTPHLEIESIRGFIQLAGPMLWGFSFWWLILSAIKIIRALLDRTLPFALSWWAFTFPLGAIAVATGALNTVLGLEFFRWAQVGLTLLLLAVWLVVAVLTLRGIGNSSIFED